jgi:hypothetical protein
LSEDQGRGVVSTGSKTLENLIFSHGAHTLAAFNDVPNLFVRHGLVPFSDVCDWIFKRNRPNEVYQIAFVPRGLADIM